MFICNDLMQESCVQAIWRRQLSYFKVEIGVCRMMGVINASYMEWSVSLGACMLSCLFLCFKSVFEKN